MKRRTFLQSTVTASAVGIAMSAGLVSPSIAIAAEEGSPFAASTVDDALKALGMTGAEESKDISIKAPEIAENGAVVPVTISTTIEGANEIALVVAENPTPLAGVFKMGEGAEATASTRIKMGKTSDVIALVKAGDKVYTAKQEVKVTIGGCGG